MNAPEALRESIKQRGQTHAAFAKELGASVTSLSLWLNGHSRPGITFATKIQEATGIPATDWARSEPSPERVKSQPAPTRTRGAIPRRRASGKAA